MPLNGKCNFYKLYSPKMPSYLARISKSHDWIKIVTKINVDFSAFFRWINKENSFNKEIINWIQIVLSQSYRQMFDI